MLARELSANHIRKAYVVFILVLGLCGIWGYMNLTKPAIQPGKIIILNATSTTGKTTIAREIAKQSGYNYVIAGLDHLFCGVFHPEMWKNVPAELMESRASADERGPLFHIQFGNVGQQAIEAMHGCIAAYSKAGLNIVVDYILYDPSWIRHLKKEMTGLPVYLVKINAPLEVIEQREKSRATSPQGHARAYYAAVHQSMVYDLEVDSTGEPTEVARKILDFITVHPEPKAFKQLK